MKRFGVLLAGVLASTALIAAPASAAPSQAAFCIPESLTLFGTKDSICLMAPTPSIDPPFFAVREHNGSQRAWCLYTEPDYLGLSLRVPAFSGTRVIATFASARPC